MAITPSYEHNNTLKKMSVNTGSGAAEYWMKDADLRSYIASNFNDAVFKSVDGTFNSEGSNLATEAAIATWVQDQISDLSGAMHFKGVVTRSAGQTDRQAIDAFYTAAGEVPAAGDFVIFTDNTKEYVCNNAGTGIASATWSELGDESIYLTTATAAATYVPLTRKITDSISLASDVSTADLQTALDVLKASDYSLETFNVVGTDISVSAVQGGTVNVSAASPVNVPATFSALDVTPAGTVSATASGAAASYDKTTSITVASAAPVSGESGNYTPAGAVTLPTYSATFTPTTTTESVDTVTSAGTDYSLTSGSVTKGSDTTGSFIKKGVSFGIDPQDAETLVLNYVTDTTQTDFFGSAVTASGSVSYSQPVLSGALPTFGTKNLTYATDGSVGVSADGSASFNGTPTVISASPVHTSTSATVTQPTIDASFSGTSKSVTPAAATTVSALPASGSTVTLTDSTINPTFTAVAVGRVLTSNAQVFGN